MSATFILDLAWKQSGWKSMNHIWKSHTFFWLKQGINQLGLLLQINELIKCFQNDTPWYAPQFNQLKYHILLNLKYFFRINIFDMMLFWQSPFTYIESTHFLKENCLYLLSSAIGWFVRLSVRWSVCLTQILAKNFETSPTSQRV